MAILIGLAVLALLLTLGALGAFLAARRVVSRAEAEYARGANATPENSDRRGALVNRLYAVAVVCLLLAAADGVAIYTFLNYANTP